MGIMNTNKTLALCDMIIDRIEASREITGWLEQARREAEDELKCRQIARGMAEHALRGQGWFALTPAGGAK